MIRKTTCLILCLLLMAPAAGAELQRIPSRDTFSMAYSRLETAIARERPVLYSASVSAETFMDYEGGMAALGAMLSSLELNGAVQAYKDGGGYLAASALSGGREFLSMGQMTREGRVGISLNGETVSTEIGQKAETAAMLMLDNMGQSLLSVDYEDLRAGNIPFLTPIYNYGIRLWQLASPYSEENNRLSVSSGSTSHGQSYSIDTMALRTMLKQWVEELNRDGFTVGLAGTDLSFGLSEETFNEFVEKARVFANTVELSKPITFNMAFGEGDVLRTAKGSGTLLEGSRKTGISYSYSCSLSSTRVTRKYNIDFQPREGDTLVLTCTWLTSSNNAKSGAHEVAINANGVYNGEPYRIKINSEMVNKYTLDSETERLTEIITGTLTANVKYGGVEVLDVTIHRNGEAYSAIAQNALTIAETLDTTIITDKGTLFKGLVSLDFRVEENTEVPDLYLARPIEQMDFSEVETLRAKLSGALDKAKQTLSASLPIAAIEALFSRQ